MRASLAVSAIVAAGLLLGGCNQSLEDIAPKAERRLPQSIVTAMQAKDMRANSPIMIRIFKEESVLEVWKQKANGRYDIIATYEICQWSGKLGPKFTEGDRQAPEGFYAVRPGQMNPRSSYHLAFNIGFPNAFDRANGRSGQHLMVHGACSSAGCYSMEDAQIEQIYAFARDAFRGGQTEFQIQAFPFRMTAANMARYRDDPNYDFWSMLKEGYDHFEITRVPPQVNVCNRRYVFNQTPQAGHSFSPSAACPPMTQPEALQTAYRSYQRNFDAAFQSAVAGEIRVSAPAASITGLREAAQVADWSRRRARGEQVTRLPPNMQPAAPVATAVAAAPAAPTPAAEAAQPVVATATTATTAAGHPPIPLDNPTRSAQASDTQEPRSRLSRLLSMFGN